MTNNSARERAERIHVIQILVEITADHHKQKLTPKVLKELAEDAASALADHEAVEGNAVEAVSAEIVGGTS